MTDANYLNQRERILMPIKWQHIGDIGEVITEIPLEINDQELILTNAMGSGSNIRYPIDPDGNGYFAVDGGHVLRCQKSGLYSITITSCFKEVDVDGNGARQHYLTFTRGAEPDKRFCYTTVSNTTSIDVTTVIPDCGTTISSNVVLALVEGDLLKHVVAAWNETGAGPIPIYGTSSDGVGNSFTRFTAIYLNNL